MKLEELNSSKQLVLSHIKSSVVFNLLPYIAEYDEKAKNALKNVGFSLRVTSAGGPGISVRKNRGETSLFLDKKPLAKVILWLPTPNHLNRLLGDGKAFVLPILLSINFKKIIEIFKTLTDRLQFYLNADESVQKDHLPFITKLLMFASAHGIAEAAENDSFLFPQIRHMPDGKVRICVEDDADLVCTVEKSGNRFSVGRGFAEPGISGEQVNAELIFSTTQTAYEVLTGKRNAMSALGLTDVRIRGNRLLIRGLFPILDRLGFYMAVK